MHRKIIKVFLASPGDLKAERQAAHRVVGEMNRMSADFWNAQVELVGWEDTVSRFGRAQELINQELDQCELFVGIMWQKWGSAPGGEGHPYTSGFEEEYHRSLQRREETGSPEMSLLFKAPEEGRMEDPGPEITKVLKFRRDVIDGKKILFQDFSELQEFEARLRSLLTDYIQRMLIKERASEARIESGTKSSLADKESTVAEASAKGTLLPPMAQGFIEEVLHRTQANESVTVADIARFRLIASSLGRSGNDDETLGPHDANLLYKMRNSYEFTPREIECLLSAGVKSFDNGNVPLWAWLYINSANVEEPLVWQYFSDDKTIQVNAIKCITLAGYDLMGLGALFDRGQVIKLWLNSEADEVRLAAMDYLAAWGTTEEVSLLTPHFDAPNSTIVERSVSAAVAITARHHVEEALTLINNNPAATIDEKVLDAAFGRAATVRSGILLEGIGHRSVKVRERAIEVLCGRKALPDDAALKLLEDREASVRFRALQYLVKCGHKYSMEEARKYLVRTANRPQAGGLLGIFGSFQIEGNDFFSRFKRQALESLPLKDLRELAALEKGSDFDATEALYSRDYKREFPSMSANLQDRFLVEFTKRLDALGSDASSNSDSRKQLETRSDQIREDMRDRTLKIICEAGGAEAVEVVRLVLDRDQVQFSPEIVDFLERFGDWEDIQRVADLSSRYTRKHGLLYFNTNEEKRAAKAILKIGKNRTADILGLGLSGSLLAFIISGLASKNFSALDDQAVLTLLNHEAGNVRRVTALKAIISYPRARVAHILKTYVEREDYRFYNVIHWLDLGVSTPLSFARAVASRALG